MQNFALLWTKGTDLALWSPCSNNEGADYVLKIKYSLYHETFDIKHIFEVINQSAQVLFPRISLSNRRTWEGVVHERLLLVIFPFV